MFKSKPIDPMAAEDLRRLGRLEAAVESLELKWIGYRDELKKLVNRLEKRDERLLTKLAKLENNEESTNGGDLTKISELNRRIAARRGQSALSQ